MNGLKYPLEQLMSIKKNRYDQAVKVLEEKKLTLLQEEKKLQEVEARRDKVFRHKEDKLLQLRSELDQGTTSDKIQQMKNYLKVVEEELSEKQAKVDMQIKAVKKAKEQVELARKELFAREKDLEKLKIHKKEWEKEVKYWSEQKEGTEHDELGSSRHTVRKIEERKKSREKP